MALAKHAGAADVWVKDGEDSTERSLRLLIRRAVVVVRAQRFREVIDLQLSCDLDGEVTGAGPTVGAVGVTLKTLAIAALARTSWTACDVSTLARRTASECRDQARWWRAPVVGLTAQLPTVRRHCVRLSVRVRGQCPVAEEIRARVLRGACAAQKHAVRPPR